MESIVIVRMRGLLLAGMETPPFFLQPDQLQCPPKAEPTIDLPGKMDADLTECLLHCYQRA